MAWPMDRWLTLLSFGLVAGTKDGWERGLLAPGKPVLAELAGVAGLGHTLRDGHTLRVCNALRHEMPLQVFHQGRRLTERSLQYEECGTWGGDNFGSGQELNFKFGDESGGDMVISDLPSASAVIAVVVFDLKNMGRSFESQVFERLDSVQVAVFDVYQGPDEARLLIQHASTSEPQQGEKLQFDNAIIVQPGHYDLVLEDAGGHEKDRASFAAEVGESYVVVRCGGDLAEGHSHQDVFVYPKAETPKDTEEDSGGSSRVQSSERSSPESSRSSGSDGADSSASGESPSFSLGLAAGLATLAGLALVSAIVAMMCLSSA